MLKSRAWMTFTLTLLVAPGLAFADGKSPADPKAILEASTQALKSLESLTYSGELTPQGSTVQEMPKLKGTVVQARAKKGLKFRVKGSLEMEGKTHPFHVINDGERVMNINAEDKKYIEGPLPDAMPLVHPAAAMVMQRMAAPDPFENEIDETLTLEAPQTVAGVECDVVRVSFEDKDQGDTRFYFGKADHLMRRLDRNWVQEGEKGGIIFIAADMKANSKLDADAFEIKAPEGFTKVEFKPRQEEEAAPELLANGSDAPDWTLKTPDGKDVNLKKDLAGKVVLIDFWATWCGPCKAVMPEIQKVFDHYKNNKDVAIYGVSTWEKRGGDPAGYMKSKELTYGLLVGGDKVAADYKVSGIPTFYLVGKDGKIAFSEVGAGRNMKATLIKLIDEALAKK